MASTRKKRPHSSYKRRLVLSIVAPEGGDEDSLLMQRFVHFMNTKGLLNTDGAWVVEAMFAHFKREAGFESAVPVSKQVLTPGFPHIHERIDQEGNPKPTTADQFQTCEPAAIPSVQHVDFDPDLDGSSLPVKPASKMNWGVMNH